ncbi:MAG TPA: xanthine dehydrogenase family protein subunit M [Candidatus Acidoferrales bacterium]|nr:xanthine dehydrogenase family protein subunit M [Candidatus Acidoferrales bacterium]
MQAFAYASPSSLNEAVGLLDAQWGRTAILAGGTDLLSLMKDDGDDSMRLVNIKKIAELARVREENGGYQVGALVTFDQFLTHRALPKRFPALAMAAEGVSSPQIRNMGTLGGDLLQRPRCWYYRGGYGLLAMNNGKSLVPGGDNRYHAIFGNEGPAYFVSPSSLAPALVALGAKVTLHGASGQREIPVEELFVIPKADGEREHSIRPNEILTEISIPAGAQEWRNATYEVREKMALDWPLATASVALKMDGGTIREARVVLGHAAPTPWRSRVAEQALEGKSLDESAATAAGEAATQGAKPLSDNGYKVQLVRVAVKRALLQAKEVA